MEMIHWAEGLTRIGMALSKEGRAVLLVPNMLPSTTTNEPPSRLSMGQVRAGGLISRNLMG
jgi:hypothetical protein